MKITTKGIYGLQAILDLALRSGGAPVPLRDIARRQGVSEKYLEQIFTLLKKAGLVTVRRGAAGGYALGPDGTGMTVRQILTALEGPLEPVPCLSCGDSLSCDRTGDCLTRPFWQSLADQISRAAEEITLERLVACCRETEEGPATDFII